MTNEQRQLLINQYRILALLDKGSQAAHELNADILERGQMLLYGEVFNNLQSEIPAEVGQETAHILTMFRAIKNGLGSLTDEQRAQLNEGELVFHGFDANRSEHHSTAVFLIDKMRYYPEYDASTIDSHSTSSLPKYRGMLAVFNARDTHETLTFEELQKLAATESIWS